jgi:lysophospholipase L1-like esterase
MSYYKKTLFIVLVALTFIFSFGWFSQSTKIRIFLIGDSTMANKPLADNPERGWGQLLPMYFNDNVTIENFARNGRSTKSFINEGIWKTVLNKLEPGDYLFIQFGHNDEKVKDTSRYAPPFTSYKNNLIKFVKEAREKGALPVLITPVNRRKFNSNKKLVDTHGDYPEVVRQVAKEQNVPLIDLYESSKILFSKLGPDGTKKIFLWVPKAQYASLPNGKKDDTHFSLYGAEVIAGLVAGDIKKLGLALAKDLVNINLKNLVGNNKVVGLDYFYNNEYRKNKEGKEERYHYIWEDTTNSGYSKLGDEIVRLGAGLSKLTTAPTKQALKNFSIYIIVDPDTPQETAKPNYMEPDQIKVITNWVKNGGILMLMENDKGNAEFEHFNKLAEKFGIHFNEDSRNDVIGNKFEMGRFNNLPDEPIFKNVKQIYMKEICTLKLTLPAKPILVDKGDNIIAFAKYGKGAVFAVGDPWIYNEYYDNKKLPADYENYKAAENLMAWLLSMAKKVKK